MEHKNNGNCMHTEMLQLYTEATDKLANDKVGKIT